MILFQATNFKSSRLLYFCAMNTVLYDHPDMREALLPLTFMRPVGKILVGLQTLEDKWKRYLGGRTSFLTVPYLQGKFPMLSEEKNLLVNAAICPDEALTAGVQSLEENHCLVYEDILIACCCSGEKLMSIKDKGFDITAFTSIVYKESVPVIIDRPWKIFANNAAQISADFEILTKNRTSFGIDDPHTIVYGADNVFVEEGVDIKAAVINAEGGPVYIGKDCHIHEGAKIKGPFGILEGSNLNMGAKVRNGSTIGPFCKIGGEINNSVIFGYSNKGHEGFLGNSVVAEWCNFGADSNNSNLKNNYAAVKLWSYLERSFVDTGRQFCGLIMGDHSKCGINTMFNTGTVVGISANIFGAGFPSNFVPSFSWGGSNNFTTYRFSKALEVARNVLERREIPLDEQDEKIFKHIFEYTAGFRNWE